MHQQVLIVWPLMALLIVGGLLVGVLFLLKRTGPLAWALLGLGALGLMFVVSFAWVSVDRRDVSMAPRARHTVEAWPHVGHDAEHVEHPVDIAALLGPRIQLDGKTVVMDESAVVGESAHRSQPARPLEVQETVEGAPPGPQRADESHAESHDEQIAPPSDSAGSFAAAPGDSPRTAPARPSPAGKNRPGWVDNAPPRDPQNYPVVIVTDPFPSKHEADRQVSQLMVVATSEVISDLVGEYGPQYTSLLDHSHPHNYRVALERLGGMGLTPGELRRKVWRDEHVEHLDLDLPTGEMVRVHTLLEFDEEFQSELQRRWREYQAHERLGIIGMIAASVVGLLAVVWGALKFDTATKGYYTKWLVAGGGLAALAAVGAALLAVA